MISVESILRGGEIPHFEKNFRRMNATSITSTNQHEKDIFMEVLPDILSNKYRVPVMSYKTRYGTVVSSTKIIIDSAVEGLKAAHYLEVITPTKSPTAQEIVI